MGGIAQAVGSIFGAGGQGGSYTAAPITQQTNLVPQIQQGQSNVENLYGVQNNLAQALQQQMAGQGPNLANALLHQATNQNMAQSAAMMASQQGINPALAARSAGQNLAQAQQQAAAQASLNQVQQQLMAQQQLGGLYGQMGNQQLTQQQINQGALANQNSATNQQSQIGSSMAQANMQDQRKAMSGLLGGASSILGLGLAHGGQIPEHLKGMAEHLGYGGKLANSGGHVDAKAPEQKAEKKGDSKQNDKIPTILSEGEIVIPRSVAMAEDAPAAAAEFVAKIKGQKKGSEEDDFKSALKRGMKERKK